MKKMMMVILLCCGALTALAQTKPKDDCGCELKLPSDALAVVNGLRISEADIDAPIKTQIEKLKQPIMQARQREMDLQINAILLATEAKKRGLTTTQLLEREVIAKISNPSEAEAQAFYEQNKNQLGADFQTVKGEVVNLLRNQREEAEAKKFADRLRAAAHIKMVREKLSPPENETERARVVATINDQPITLGQLEDQLLPLIYNVQEQLYGIRKKQLDRHINDTLLQAEALRRKLTPAALLEAEVIAKSKKITAADAQLFYEQNKDRMNGAYAQIKEQLVQYLQQRENLNAENALAENLQRAAAIQIYLPAPSLPASALKIDDQPSLGAVTAPVTIVAFTDFACPTCAKTQPLLERLCQEFAGKVRLVMRDFPLEKHAQAFKAAEAAEAARAQGKYWEYAALLFQQQNDLSVEKLKELAGQIKLDRTQFDAALDSGSLAEKVNRDLQDAAWLGINATPTIFINGRRATDKSYEAIKAAIENALKESPSKQP